MLILGTREKFRDGGRIHAVGATCTHYGGPLVEGIVVDGQVRCPWHHACFDLATGTPHGPAITPLACWDVTLEGGRIRVGARRVWFTHMTHDLRHEPTCARLPAGMELAYDGLVVDC